MKKQIVKVSAYQTAKVAAGLYFILSLPAVLIMAAVFAVLPNQGIGLPLLILMPLLYAFCGFIFTAIGAWLYNIVAARIGGFEFITREVEAGV